MEVLLKRGIQTAIHYPIPIHLQVSYAEYKKQSTYLKNTEEQAGELVSLPIYPDLTDEEVEYVASSVLETIEIICSFGKK